MVTIKVKKIDGHTHTHYCPHGSGDHVEKMIEAAIQLGIEEYHITEHTPIPESFARILEPQEKLRGDIAMPESEVDRYLKEMLGLKQKYQSQIDIKVGFEVDYLPGHETWIRDFLNEYGPYCDTGILSLHYLSAGDHYRCVDYTPEEVVNHLIPHYGSLDAYQMAYYELVEEMILSDLGDHKPTRIGHLTLVDKFQKQMGNAQTDQLISKKSRLLRLIKEKSYELDYNHAGLFKPLCGETYPPLSIVKEAKALDIPLVFGSDAHGVEDLKKIHNHKE